MKPTTVILPFRERTKDEFLSDRKDGIGSSDAAHLLNEGDYGCLRYLEIEKSGLWELPQRTTFNTKRGEFFEPIVADLFATLNGTEVSEMGPAHLKEFPFIKGNLDRVAYFPEGETILEIKVPAAGMFRKIKKEGKPPIGYVLQSQWLMLAYGMEKAVLFFYWPDGHEWISFKLDADREMHKLFLAKADAAWRMIEELRKMPAEEAFSLLSERKPEGSKACENCSAYDHCFPGISFKNQVDLPSDLQEKAIEFLELNPELKELEERVEELKDSLKDWMKTAGAAKATFGDFEVSLSPRSRTSVSGDAKKIFTPEQTAQFVKTSEFHVLTIKPKKK